MELECELVDVPPVTLAVTETFLRLPEIPKRITAQFDLVYNWIHNAAVHQTGHNYALYDPFGPNGMRMRVGFPVNRRFDDDGNIACFELRAGKAAHAQHRGPYTELHQAYTRLNAWCADRAIDTNGLNWEVYGDRYDDPEKRITDIYIAVQPALKTSGI